MSKKYLKLLAYTKEDLNVISAHLQDAIVFASDIAYLKKNRILLIQLNRFMWEDVEKGVFRKNKRIRTVLKFDNVMHVVSKNINQNDKNVCLDFLAIESKIKADKSYDINLIFSGGAIVEINSEVIEVKLDDQGSPWVSKAKPKHKFI